MKSIRKSLIISLLLIVAFGAFSQSFTIYKDGNQYVSVDSNKKKLLRSESASAVIQFAIDKCGNKDGEIILGKGFFELDTPVKLKENIWIHGKRRGTELKLKKPNSKCFELAGVNNVRISELTFTCGDNGNSLAGIHGENSSNCHIRDVIIMGFANFGLSFSGDCRGLIINRCTFVENDKAHIYLENFGDTKGQPVIVKNSTFFRGGYGVKTYKGEGRSKGVEVNGNAFAYLKGPGIDTDFDSAVITGNRIYWCESDGMRVKGEGLYFSGNTNSWTRGHGLVLDGATNGTVIGNNITDLGVRYLDGLHKCGIAMYRSSQITISGNSIWNFGDQSFMEYAIYEDESCKDNSIFANAGWFHVHDNAFLSLGNGTSIKDNTSNKGKYRGDFWDFKQKFGYTIDKYLESLFLDGNYKPTPDPDTNSPEINGTKVIECKDLFNQVVTISSDTVKRFGWTGSKMQVWNLRKEGEYYFIVNEETDLVLECNSQDENARVALGQYNGNDSQLWKLENVGNGYYKIENRSIGKVIGSQGFDTFMWKSNEIIPRGQVLTVSDYKGKEFQMWRFIEPEPAYTYKK